MEGTYITSEHSYQKPQSFSQDCQSLTELGSSDDDDASSFEEDGELHMGNKSHFLSSAKELGVSEKVMAPVEKDKELIQSNTPSPWALLRQTYLFKDCLSFSPPQNVIHVNTELLMIHSAATLKSISTLRCLQKLMSHAIWKNEFVWDHSGIYGVLIFFLSVFPNL